MDLLARTLSTVLLLGVLALSSCSPESAEKNAHTKTGIRQLQQKLIDMRRSEKALEQEYALARNSAPYLVAHLANRTVELKARGRILRSFKITRLGETPVNIDNATWVLSEAKPIQKTDRPKIKPGEGDSAAAEAAKWGLHRMPQDFDLVCEEGKIMEFRALPSEQSGSAPIISIKSLYRRTVDWYRRWRSPDRSQAQVIQIWMDENDSRLIFWSLPKQLKILILAAAFASDPLTDCDPILQRTPIPVFA
jgi:hypothetical protein